jgi:hypothetical protein
MDFAFHWTNQKDGKHAIQKRDTGKRGQNDFREGGKEIERKGNQTSKTHFFLNIDDGLWEVAKINRILKTITYNYVYKGTNKKAIRHYLTKTDIETILNNITDYENKTIEIQVNPPDREQTEKLKEAIKTLVSQYEEIYGEEKIKKLYELVIQRENKKKELEKQEKEANAEIRKITERITEKMKRFEEAINADVEKLDKDISIVLRSKKKMYKDIDTDTANSKLLPLMAKYKRQQEAARIRQQIYRERKNAESGKPKKET